jgi:large subunit ribosomal protein L27Ae
MAASSCANALWHTQFLELALIFSSLQLWSLIPAEKRDEYLSGSKKDTVPVLDLLPLGYSKVLGKGRIPEVPLVVRARWFSKEAERKITEAGGVVELVA